jgi:N-hydroxyarylamine O-acetyltransferase
MSEAELFARYLGLIGVIARRPSLEALGELTTAHLCRVPFENVSKLLHRDDPSMRLPPLERWLENVERHGLGGTCYANNSHFGELLAHLGYDVRLCGADMRAPDVHVANIVTLAGREYLVDVGYGAAENSPTCRA